VKDGKDGHFAQRMLSLPCSMALQRKTKDKNMNRTLIAILIAVWAVIAISAIVYTFQQCGARTFLLGNGGFFAAMTGMCD